MSEERGCAGGMFLAFLAGGLLGAGLALLLAPMAGREAREKIGDIAGDLKQRAEGMAETIRDKVGAFVEEEKSAIKAAYEAGREAMEKERARFAKGEQPDLPGRS